MKVLKVKIKTLDFLTVGSEVEGFVDIVFFRDVDGRLVIPSSSIKGVLRKAIKDCTGRDVLGELDTRFPPIYITDFHPEDGQTTVLYHVSIEDRTGKASEGKLFSREAFPPLTVFEGRIYVFKEDILEDILSGLKCLRFETLGKGCMVDVMVEDLEDPELGRWFYAV